MAKFKCKHTGVVLEFHEPHDVEGLRKHPEYDEVVEQEEQPKVKQEKPKKEPK